MRKHCIAIGGGGWMMGENPSPLDQYILSLSGKENPNICFLPTATGDADEVIERFYNAKLSENVTHFPLFKFDAGWKETLFEQDIIYVGGGIRVRCWPFGANGESIEYSSSVMNKASSFVA